MTLAAVALAAFAALAACGGAKRAPAGPASNTAPPAADPRTPIERRRDAACDHLGPKLTACAVEDARADLAADKVSQAQFNQDTATAIQQQNTDAFEKQCKGTTYSTRQVRVLEVCFHDEPRCAQLLDCLGHVNDAPAPHGAS